MYFGRSIRVMNVCFSHTHAQRSHTDNRDKLCIIQSEQNNNKNEHEKVDGICRARNTSERARAREWEKSNTNKLWIVAKKNCLLNMGVKSTTQARTAIKLWNCFMAFLFSIYYENCLLSFLMRTNFQDMLYSANDRNIYIHTLTNTSTHTHNTKSVESCRLLHSMEKHK